MPSLLAVIAIKSLFFRVMNGFMSGYFSENSLIFNNLNYY